MLDEPFLGVAPIIIEEVMGALRRLSDEGVTLLLVEQNIHRAMDFVDTRLRHRERPDACWKEPRTRCSAIRSSPASFSGWNSESRERATRSDCVGCAGVPGLLAQWSGPVRRDTAVILRTAADRRHVSYGLTTLIA